MKSGNDLAVRLVMDEIRMYAQIVNDRCKLNDLTVEVDISRHKARRVRAKK